MVLHKNQVIRCSSFRRQQVDMPSHCSSNNNSL